MLWQAFYSNFTYIWFRGLIMPSARAPVTGLSMQEGCCHADLRGIQQNSQRIPKNPSLDWIKPGILFTYDAVFGSGKSRSTLRQGWYHMMLQHLLVCVAEESTFLMPTLPPTDTFNRASSASQLAIQKGEIILQTQCIPTSHCVVWSTVKLSDPGQDRFSNLSASFKSRGQVNTILFCNRSDSRYFKFF